MLTSVTFPRVSTPQGRTAMLRSLQPLQLRTYGARLVKSGRLASCKKITTIVRSWDIFSKDHLTSADLREQTGSPSSCRLVFHGSSPEKSLH